MNDFFKKDSLLIFAGGIVTGIVGLKVIKTQKVRSAAVKTLAQGMMTKDCVMEEYTNIREEAEDICAEAKALAAAKADAKSACDCGCDCDCGDGCEVDVENEE